MKVCRRLTAKLRTGARQKGEQASIRKGLKTKFGVKVTRREKTK